MSRFAPTGGVTSGGTTSIRSKTTPAIQNVSLVLANTEYSITIPVNTVEFSIRTRKNSLLKLAYTATESGTKYITIWPGETYTESAITDSASLTLYVQSSKADEIIEVWSWT